MGSMLWTAPRRVVAVDRPASRRHFVANSTFLGASRCPPQSGCVDSQPKIVGKIPWGSAPDPASFRSAAKGWRVCNYL